MRRICALAAAVVAAAAGLASAQSTPPRHAEAIGTSVEAKAITLVRVGDPAAPRKVLVVGCIHGNERAGIAITKALRSLVPPRRVQLLVLDMLNPDSCTGTPRRTNAHGVDLNRNFPWGWRPLSGIFYSGPRPSSEPETRAAERLVLRERPEVSIWYHQHEDLVDLQRGSSVRLMELYARIAGMRAIRTPPLPGTAARWENHAMPGHTAFVVELPAGSLSPAAVHRHVAAVAALAAAIAR